MINKEYTYKYTFKPIDKEVVYENNIPVIYYNGEKRLLPEVCDFCISSEVKLTRLETYEKVKGTIGWELYQGEFKEDELSDDKYYTPELEIWKDVVGYENEYEVSNYGEVRRKVSNLKQAISPHGYRTLSLSKNGKISTEIVHRLVAKAFIENPEMKEQVNHKDCNKINNNIENLEWMTPQENIDHAVLNERQRDQSGENNNMSKLTTDDVILIKQMLSDGITAYKINKEYYPHLHLQTIYGIKQGRLWKHI